MRRLIVATLSAALVVIGLSAVLVGTASAATPSAEPAVCASLKSALTSAERALADYTGNVVSERTALERAVADAKTALQNNNCNGGGSGTRTSCADYNRDGIYNIPRGDSRYREALDRDRDGLACERNEGNVGGPIYNGPRYGSCQEYGTHNLRDFSRGDVRYRADWDRNNNGIACDNGDVVVSNDGRCVTFRDQNRDYGNRYNSLYNVRLDQARSINSDGGRAVTRNEERAIEDAADLRDFRNRWTSTRDELRTICNDPTPEVQIITVPAAPVTTVTAAPPPPPAVSAPSVGSIPSGSVNTGGWSPAFVLAHNRAV